MERYGAGLLIAGVAIIAYGFRTLLTAGLFKTITLADGTFFPERVALRTVRGPYQNIGKEFEKLLGVLNEIPSKPVKDPGSKTIGIYHDDPCAVGDKNCRTSIGVCLNSFRNPNKVQEELVKRGFTVVELPKAKALVGAFPFTGTLSILLYLNKMFGDNGALAKYQRENPDVASKRTDIRHIEVYTMSKNLLEVYVTLENMGDIFDSLLKDS